MKMFPPTVYAGVPLGMEGPVDAIDTRSIRKQPTPLDTISITGVLRQEEAVKRIDLSDMEYEIGDDLRLEYDGEPFTEEAVETAGEMVVAQAFYVDGIRHGNIRQWWANGNIRSEGEVFHGTPTGVHRTWHFNGRLAEETEFSEAGRLCGATGGMNWEIPFRLASAPT